MKPLLLPLLVLSALLPLASRAQLVLAPAPRCYISGQLSYQRFNGFIEGGDVNEYRVATFFGPVLRGGWQLSARTALEIGAGLSYHGWHTDLGAFTFEGIEPRLRSVTLVVPVQLTTQLLRRPRRWGLEIQAGLALVQQYVGHQTRHYYPGPDARIIDGPSSLHRDVPVLLGLAATCRVASRWQAVVQLQSAWSFRYLGEAGSDFQAALPGGGGSLGVRYSFSRRPTQQLAQ